MTKWLHQPGARLRALPGSLLLATHLLAGTSLLPGLVAALAWGDGQHWVSLRANPGQVAVVLAHCPGAAPHRERCARHEHSGVSHVLASFAETRHPEADHVLSFRTVSELRSQRDRPVDALALPNPFAVCAVPVTLPWPAGQPVPTRDVTVLRSDPLYTLLRSVSLLI